MRTFHLTLHEGLTSVYLSQVARPMSQLRERGLAVDLVVFARIGELLRGTARRRWKSRRQEIQRDFGLELHLLRAPPSRAPRLWSEANGLAAWYRKRRDPAIPVRFHCRGPNSAAVALSLRSRCPEVQVLFDCRGVTGAEYAYERGYPVVEAAPPDVRLAAEALEARERHVARSANTMICVSEAMSRVVQSRWCVPASKISVVPCCTDVRAGTKAAEARHALRRQLGLQDRFVVLYNGSLASWQMPGECIRLFQRMRALRSDAHWLVLTTQPEQFRVHLQRAGVQSEHATILSVSHSEVSQYLSVGDAALLIRERCLVNEVASPVKFAEYLAAGLPVIISEGVGDYSELVREHRLGVVLKRIPSQSPDGLIVRLFDELNETSRRSCQNAALRKLDWAVHLDESGRT